MTNLLGLLRQESKDEIRTILPIFDILINSNTFVTSLSPEKIAKAITTTKTALSAKILVLKKGQIFYGLSLLLCQSHLARLGFYTFSLVNYPISISSLTKRQLLLEVWMNLIWWNTFFLKFNIILISDNITWNIF